jgi:hypothetical protein
VTLSRVNSITFSTDLKLERDAANTLAQRNGLAAQESRIYGTYTGAGDYRRLALKMSTAGVAQIVAEGAGSGASGNVLQLPSNTTFADAPATRTALGLGTGDTPTFTTVTAAVFSATGNGFYAAQAPIRLGTSNAMYFRALASTDTVSLTSSAGGTNYRDLKLRNLIASGDVEVTDSASGIILKSPDGTRYRVTVSDLGVLSTASLP